MLLEFWNICSRKEGKLLLCNPHTINPTFSLETNTLLNELNPHRIFLRTCTLSISLRKSISCSKKENLGINQSSKSIKTQKLRFKDRNHWDRFPLFYLIPFQFPFFLHHQQRFIFQVQEVSNSIDHKCKIRDNHQWSLATPLLLVLSYCRMIRGSEQNNLNQPSENLTLQIT